MSVASIAPDHGQRLREYSPDALRVTTDEVAYVKYKQGAYSKQFGTLYLAETVAVDVCRALAATGAYCALACGVSRECHDGILPCHAVRRDAPLTTFFLYV